MNDAHEPHMMRAREQISVRVLFFGAARESVGHDELQIDLPAPASVATLRDELFRQYPPLARFGRALLIAVNEEYATPETELRENDEVAFFPPVSGGASNAEPDDEANGASDIYELTIEPIDVGSVARRVVPETCGATVTLDGYVREWTKGRRTLYLVYEAYEQMALREMRRIGAEARKRFDIAHISIVHRTGQLEIGETSVVISVGAPHRRAAFEACEWLIKELKRTVPIWKKEFYEGGEVWVEGEAAPQEDSPAQYASDGSEDTL